MRQTQRDLASYKGGREPRPTILCPEQSLTHRDGGWVERAEEVGLPR